MKTLYQVNMTQHLQQVMNEMFKRVGETYSIDYVLKQDWFLNHTWTVEEQQDFIDWLADYLYKNKEARQEILSTKYHHTKEFCERAARQFAFNYGWKYADKP